ncbi:hypothetical protein MRI28_21905 [Nocardiopsis dassonvillei]|uniref:hypothetical protein n=1 Tax=Nocardiopsis dassonvillei TaxID=2014 RepID=UPI00200D3E6D|nr:hypothetical protein [Nocardiopsis dassonvillei]MCK9872260.1 hypothetical protein [Nocardiopsis dassonvillei]
MRNLPLPRRLPPSLPALGLLVAATACTVPTTDTVDIVSFTETTGAACTSVVVMSPGDSSNAVDEGDETESSTDCETAPAEHDRVERDRRALSDPRPDEEWEMVEMLTITDAHGRACTLVVITLGTGAVDETSIDCDYPPQGARPGPDSRQPRIDPDPDSDYDRVEVVTFTDEHDRTCVTTTAQGGIGIEVDITCEYTDGPPLLAPVETAMPS